MNDEKIYFAVNEDGEELASNTPLYRKSDLMSKAYGKKWTENFLKGKPGIWCNVYKEERDGPIIEFTGVKLPKGTIELLTGIKMKWEDEPILCLSSE